MKYDSFVQQELLVAADVIETLCKPSAEYTLESLYKVYDWLIISLNNTKFRIFRSMNVLLLFVYQIGLVVVIRTVLSYFLEIEIEGIEHKLHKLKWNSFDWNVIDSMNRHASWSRENIGMVNASSCNLPWCLRSVLCMYHRLQYCLGFEGVRLS